jgi:hypothetical protein
MEVIFSSETSVYFQRNTLRYIPEDTTLHVNFCVKVIFYENSFFVKIKIWLQRQNLC